MNKKKLSAFIAHSFYQEDVQITLRLKRILIKLGIRPITGDIGVDSPAEQVLKKMKESDFVVVLLTKRFPMLDENCKEWMASEWIYNEIGMAFALNKPMIFLCEKGLRSGGIKESVAGIQYFKRETFVYIVPRLGKMLSEIMEKLHAVSKGQTRVTEFITDHTE
jgi:hypothetical protein